MAAPALSVYIQGQGQVSADQLNTFEQTCDNFAQLRSLVGLPGMQVFARGGAAIADGLQGVFYWQASNPGPDNGSTVIVPSGALLGAWVKLALVTNSSFPLGQGRLVYNSSTQIQFNPYNGNSFQIQGGVYAIPAAGVTAGNAGVFVNGAANQNLVLNTLYYVYLFSNSGTPTIDFSTTGYAQDTTAGNIGVYIKNSNPSRSLIGMVYVDGSSHFNDTLVLRNVASWFNRQPKSWTGASSGGATAAGSGTLSELMTACRIEGAIWADGAPSVSVGGYCSQSVMGNGNQTYIGMDGVVAVSPNGNEFQAYTGAAFAPVGLTWTPGPGIATEGRHFFTVAVTTSSTNTGAWFVNMAGQIWN